MTEGARIAGRASMIDKEGARIAEIFKEKLRELYRQDEIISSACERHGVSPLNGWRKAASAVLSRCEARRPGGCVEWTGATSSNGYGRIKIGGRLLLPHRVIAAAVGILSSIGDRRVVIHSCDNRLCVNPDHLRAGTPSQNMRDCAAKGRLHAQRNPGAKRRRRGGTGRE